MSEEQKIVGKYYEYRFTGTRGYGIVYRLADGVEIEGFDNPISAETFMRQLEGEIDFHENARIAELEAKLDLLRLINVPAPKFKVGDEITAKWDISFRDTITGGHYEFAGKSWRYYTERVATSILEDELLSALTPCKHCEGIGCMACDNTGKAMSTTISYSANVWDNLALRHILNETVKADPLADFFANTPKAPKE